MSKKEDANTRIAIVNTDKCKPKKCRQVRCDVVCFRCLCALHVVVVVLCCVL
jgi:translation initiation factor RLI1